MGFLLSPPVCGMGLYQCHTGPYRMVGDSQQTTVDKNHNICWKPEIYYNKLQVEPFNGVSGIVRVPIDTRSFVSIASVIRHYGDIRDVDSGRFLHAELTVDQLDEDRFVSNCLIKMYGDCGSIEDARDVFDSMPRINLHSCNILINAYVKKGLCQEALDLYHHMQDDFQPDQVTYVSVLNACIGLGSLEEGRLFHAGTISNGGCGDVVVRTALVNFYGKCGSLEDASIVFEGIAHADAIFCNAMMAAYTINDHWKEALSLYDKMKDHDLSLDQATFVSALDACAANRELRVGYNIRCSAIKFGLSGDIVVGTSLIDMYSKCGGIEDSKRVFNGLSGRNTISWSAMIAAFVHCGDNKEGLSLFHGMEREEVESNRVTLISAVDACAGLANLEEGWKLHALLVHAGDEADIVVGTALINMYGECGSLDDAKDVFDEMGHWNAITWSAMIGAYAHNESGKEALEILDLMQAEGYLPNSVTFVCALDACSNLDFIEDGYKIHAAVIIFGYETDVIVATALISMYGKCGSLDEVRSVWSQMRYQTTVSLNAMIAAYTEHRQGKEGLNFFACIYATELEPHRTTFICALDACASMADFTQGQKIHSAVLDSKYAPDITIANCLIGMYGECGSVDDAKNVFDNMAEHDVISWSSLIAVCAQSGSYEKALGFFRQMQLNHVKPNYITFVSTLGACTGLKAMEEGWKIHAAIVGNGFEGKTEVGNALVNLYGKCGDLGHAKVMFERLPWPDLISWNTLIAALAQNGRDADILLYFDQMLHNGIKPDGVTLLSVLSACSHSGRVNDACHYFSSLQQTYGLEYTLQHCMCLVDLLGRAGHLDDAEDLINIMPFKESSMLWSCLLGSCKIYGDVDRAARAADRIFALDPSNVGPHITVGNVYAAANMWDDARKRQESKGLLQTCGNSSL